MKVQNPDAQFYENCDQRDQQSTQPSEPSDQKYARWYPSAIPLPNDTVLVVGGFDQDNSVAPDPDRAAKGRLNQSQSDTAFTASRVNQVVPEVYDSKSDRNIALENARMAFPLYPQLEVVQTGPGGNDWKVCTFNYLFNGDGSRAARPVIAEAPKEISYRGHFDISVAGDSRQIASVVLLRSDHNTHSLTTRDRYVKLAFRSKNDDDEEEDDEENEGRRGQRGRRPREHSELRVRAPKLPAQAVPGIYMLFVVDENGVPSVGARVDLKPDTGGQVRRSDDQHR